jgi:hypothetical protein
MDRMIFVVANYFDNYHEYKQRVHKAYEVIKKAESSCIPQIPSGELDVCD